MHTMKLHALLFTLLFSTVAVSGEMDASNRLVIHSYQDVVDLYKKENYTPEAWQAGIREIPRLYITTISDTWRTKTSKEVTTVNKKRIFFRALAPLVLRANELIKLDRQKVLMASQSGKTFNQLSAAQQTKLTELAIAYKIIKDEKPLSSDEMQQLVNSVDIIPVSLALAQGAVESGWGTSRFATQGNALFGQWTWGDHAMKPEQQRAHLGNYGLAKFETPLESVISYIHNLNTHRAYKPLRQIRTQLRKKDAKITGLALTEGLKAYSEKGDEYVALLKSMIKHNHLAAADDAYLRKMPPIFLVPYSTSAN